MIPYGSESKQSLQDSQFNTYITNTDNKTNDRLDFSYIYQQFHHYIYVLGIILKDF